MVERVKSAAKSTTIKVIVTAMVAILPATYSYCQSVYETKQKYNQSYNQSSAGYTELAKAVLQLQETAKSQHEQLLRVQIYMETIDHVLRDRGSSARPKPTPMSDAAMGLAKPSTPSAPNLEPPAADLATAAAEKN